MYPNVNQYSMNVLSDIREIFVKYSWSIHGVFICIGYVSVMYRLCIGYASELPIAKEGFDGCGFVYKAQKKIAPREVRLVVVNYCLSELRRPLNSRALPVPKTVAKRPLNSRALPVL